MPVYRPESPTQFYANYNSIPAKKTQKKINFFFNPYTLKTELQKSMVFESDEDQKFQQLVTQVLQKGGLNNQDRQQIETVLNDLKTD